MLASQPILQLNLVLGPAGEMLITEYITNTLSLRIN